MRSPEGSTEDTEREDVVDDLPGLELLLDYLLRVRGFDFNGYRKPSLTRRLRRRMQMVGVDTYAAYLDHLEVHPDEFAQLFDVVLINVTSFFRDAPVWSALDAHLRKMIDGKRPDAPIRVWSAGCASGEETYTLVMVLAEILGRAAFAKRVKIYATDVDEDALAHARAATYSAKAVQDVPPELLERYFTPSGTGYVFDKELRRVAIFGRHDLVRDAPISRIDFLTCRNALMYFNTETQSRILTRLHFALNNDGLLLLGKAEMILTHAHLFTPLDLGLRLFRRSHRGPRAVERTAPTALEAPPTEAARTRDHVHRMILDASPVAQISVDTNGALTFVNRQAASLFGLMAHDLGRQFSELELSYRPTDLRSCLDLVRNERRPVSLKEVECTSASGEATFLNVDLSPLTGEDGSHVGTCIAFTNVTALHRSGVELRKVRNELEASHQELQSASEELETTNEELQSTVEELETTNEELQSTNEELETMNEELQSTNEELQTINDELRTRGEELNHVNHFFGDILGSLKSGVVVLDRDLLVRAWNPVMTELWGLRLEEVSQKHFSNLDIGMPTEELLGPIKASLVSLESVERTIDCTNRRGRAIRCQVSVRPLKSEDGRGVILIVDEVKS